MAIRFRDFFPEVKSEGWFSTEYATLPETVARANEWLEENKVQVLNVETVVLPNTDSAEETTEIALRTSGEMSSYWYQVVRVWYLDEN